MISRRLGYAGLVGGLAVVGALIFVGWQFALVVWLFAIATLLIGKALDQ